MSRKKKRCEEVPVGSIMQQLFNLAVIHLVASMVSGGSDPFVLTEKDGKLYGHGSSDDKGPVLGWLHAVSAYNATKTEIPINLKVWKSKMKDHYHHSYQKNPFQKYGDGYGRYNNKCSKCSQYGASVRCCVSECSKIYHYPCAIVSGALQNLNILPDSKSLVSNLQMKDTIISPVIPNQQNLNILPDSKSLVSNLQMKDTYNFTCNTKPTKPLVSGFFGALSHQDCGLHPAVCRS